MKNCCHPQTSLWFTCTIWIAPVNGIIYSRVGFSGFQNRFYVTKFELKFSHTKVACLISQNLKWFKLTVSVSIVIILCLRYLRYPKTVNTWTRSQESHLLLLRTYLVLTILTKPCIWLKPARLCPLLTVFICDMHSDNSPGLESEPYKWCRLHNS